MPRPDPEKLAERFERESANIRVGRLERGSERFSDFRRGPCLAQRPHGCRIADASASRGHTQGRCQLVRQRGWQGLGDTERLLGDSGGAPRELKHQLRRWLERFVQELRELTTTPGRSRQAGGPTHVLLCDSLLEEQCFTPRRLAANRDHDHVPPIEPFTAGIGIQREAENARARQRLDPAANRTVSRACLPVVGKPVELGS